MAWPCSRSATRTHAGDRLGLEMPASGRRPIGGLHGSRAIVLKATVSVVFGQGPFTHLRAPGHVGLVDRDADDIRGEHVRGELDALEAAADGARERRAERRLADRARPTLSSRRRTCSRARCMASFILHPSRVLSASAMASPPATSATPPRWPRDARAACAFTFDLDAETLWCAYRPNVNARIGRT